MDRNQAARLQYAQNLNRAKQFVLIALPVYDGMKSKTVQSIFSLSNEWREKGIQHHISWLDNHSLIPKARSWFANLLLDGHRTLGPYSHLLFIDSDISFSSLDMTNLINGDWDVSALPYAKKEINWKAIADAAKRGVPPERLVEHACTPVLNYSGLPKVGDVQTVVHVGTGALLVKKQVFDRLKTLHPEWEYIQSPDEQQKTGRLKAVDFFQIGKSETTQQYLSEDWFFCEAVRQAGYEIHLLTSARTVHIGTFDFVMNIPK